MIGHPSSVVVVLAVVCEFVAKVGIIMSSVVITWAYTFAVINEKPTPSKLNSGTNYDDIMNQSTWEWPICMEQPVNSATTLSVTFEAPVGPVSFMTHVKL